MRFLARLMMLASRLWRDEIPAHIKRREARQSAVDRRIRAANRALSAADGFRKADAALKKR